MRGRPYRTDSATHAPWAAQRAPTAAAHLLELGRGDVAIELGAVVVLSGAARARLARSRLRRSHAHSLALGARLPALPLGAGKSTGALAPRTCAASSKKGLSRMPLLAHVSLMRAITPDSCASFSGPMSLRCEGHARVGEPLGWHCDVQVVPNRAAHTPLQ